MYRCCYNIVWRGVLDTTLCDKVCQCDSGTTVSFANYTDTPDITEIFLKVTLNSMTL
jgi:hypothetical protein